VVGLEAKFAQHPQLKDHLLATGNARLRFHSRSDNVFGDGGDAGHGRNVLGTTLESLRRQFRSAKEQVGRTEEVQDTCEDEEDDDENDSASSDDAGGDEEDEDQEEGSDDEGGDQDEDEDGIGVDGAEQ
jgi:hypothetical protein